MYSSLNIIKVNETRKSGGSGFVTLTGETKNAYTILVPKRARKYNIKIDLMETGLGSADWINLAQNRDRWWGLVSMVINLLVP
jgi:hypothetical protein